MVLPDNRNRWSNYSHTTDTRIIASKFHLHNVGYSDIIIAQRVHLSVMAFLHLTDMRHRKRTYQDLSHVWCTGLCERSLFSPMYDIVKLLSTENCMYLSECCLIGQMQSNAMRYKCSHKINAHIWATALSTDIRETKLRHYSHKINEHNFACANTFASVKSVRHRLTDENIDIQSLISRLDTS